MKSLYISHKSRENLVSTSHQLHFANMCLLAYLQKVPRDFRKLCNVEYFRGHIREKDIDTICFNASTEDIKTILEAEGEEEQLKQFDTILVKAKEVKKEKKRAEKEKR